MFGIGGIEFAAIVILALLLLGPDKIPQVARTIGRFMREFKKYQAMMESTFRAEMLQSEQEEAAEKAEERKAKAAGDKPPAKIPGEVGYEPSGAGDASEAAAVTQPEPAVDASSEAAALAQDDDPDVAFDATEPVRAPDEPESPGAEDVKEDGGTA